MVVLTDVHCEKMRDLMVGSSCLSAAISCRSRSVFGAVLELTARQQQQSGESDVRQR